MFGKKKLAGTFQSYADAKLVQQVLNSKPQESSNPLSTPSEIPYALIQLRSDSLETLRDQMHLVLSLSESPPDVVREMLLSSIVLLCFPRGDEISANIQKRDQIVQRVSATLGDQCRILSGSVLGHYGLISSVDGWFGLLCPNIERLFATLFSIEYGHRAIFDLVDIEPNNKKDT